MTWTFKHVPDPGIIEVSLTGDTSSRDLQECTSQLIALQKSEGLNRYLVDTHEMKLNASLLDIYDLPAHQYIVEQADRDGRVALILSTSQFEHQAGLFYRDTCRNQGWTVEAFFDREAAISWLTNSALA